MNLLRENQRQKVKAAGTRPRKASLAFFRNSISSSTVGNVTCQNGIIMGRLIVEQLLVNDLMLKKL